MQAPSASDLPEKKSKVTQAPISPAVAPVESVLKPSVKPSTPAPAEMVGDGRVRSIPMPLPRAHAPAPVAPAASIPLRLGAVSEAPSSPTSPAPIQTATGLGLLRATSAAPASARPPQSLTLNLESSVSPRTTAGEVAPTLREGGEALTLNLPAEGVPAPEGSTPQRLFNPESATTPPAVVQGQTLSPPVGSVSSVAPSVVVPAPNLPLTPSARATAPALPTAGLARAAEQTNAQVAVAQLTAQQLIIAERRAEAHVLGRFMRRMLGLETTDAPVADEPGR